MLCLRLPSFPSAFGFRKQNALEWWNVAAQASQREEPLLSGDLQHNYDSWKSGPVPTCAYWFNTMVRMTEAPLSPVYESGGSGGMSSLAISYAVFSSARMPTLTGGRAWLPLCVAFSPAVRGTLTGTINFYCQGPRQLWPMLKISVPSKLPWIVMLPLHAHFFSVTLWRNVASTLGLSR